MHRTLYLYPNALPPCRKRMYCRRGLPICCVYVYAHVHVFVQLIEICRGGSYCPQEMADGADGAEDEDQDEDQVQMKTYVPISETFWAGCILLDFVNFVTLFQYSGSGSVLLKLVGSEHINQFDLLARRNADVSDSVWFPRSQLSLHCK